MNSNLTPGSELSLDDCPHCSISRPALIQIHQCRTANHRGNDDRLWYFYKCTSCGGVTMALKPVGSPYLTEFWPSTRSVPEDLPARAREYMEQALRTRHAPAGSIMLTASAVDAMLKHKGYKDGTLNHRIDKAASDHLITSEMAAWAHEIRLDANDQRHADESVSLPTSIDAEKVLEFADALAQFLYVLPAMVTRGRKPKEA